MLEKLYGCGITGGLGELRVKFSGVHSVCCSAHSMTQYPYSIYLVSSIESSLYTEITEQFFWQRDQPAKKKARIASLSHQLTVP